MSIGVLGYRTYRLRRLILLAVAPPVLVVLAIAVLKGPAALVLLALAIGAPLAHILRYPNAWMETLVVSAVMSVVLILAGTIGPDVALLGLALRVLALASVAAFLFLILNGIIPFAMYAGRTKPLVARARRRSRLPAEDLKRAITLYPGRADDKVECGPPDEDGAFAVTIRHQMPNITGEELDPFDILLFAQVLHSDAESHEVMSIEAGTAEPDDAEDDDSEYDETEYEDPEDAAPEDDAPEDRAEAEGAPEDDTPPLVTVTRHTFRPTRRGTRVEVAETGAEMTVMMRWGFWLQDYIADHLTDEIDRAEGRAPRSNRFATQDQLIAEIARRFFSGGGTQHPAE